MVVQLILDFLPWPSRSRDLEDGPDLLERVLPGTLSIQPSGPGAIKNALNASGWLADEVIAAGDLRQGKKPSLLAMLTGTALVELLRLRRSKALPRHFVLAVTADRVVAFKAISGADGEDGSGPYRLWVRPGVRASWPRESVRLADPQTLVLDGIERIPVWRPNPDADPSTDELLLQLAD